MPSYSWWQMIRVLAGREPGADDLQGIMDTPHPDWQPKAVLAMLADGCAVVRGVPFDGQVHQPIPKDAWRLLYLEIRCGFPFADSYDGFGIVAILRPGTAGYRKDAGGGWHHLLIEASELAALQAAAGLADQISVPDIRTGLPGRPSPMHLIEVELLEWIDGGRQWKAKADCCRELVDWYSKTYPNLPKVSAKTVGNRLRGKIPVTRY